MIEKLGSFLRLPKISKDEFGLPLIDYGRIYNDLLIGVFLRNSIPLTFRLALIISLPPIIRSNFYSSSCCLSLRRFLSLRSQSMMDSEIDQDYGKSHGDLPSYSVSATASSTYLASGAASTAITPDSSEVVRLPSSPMDIAPGTGGLPPSRAFGTPDLLAGVPSDNAQSPPGPMGSSRVVIDQRLTPVREEQNVSVKTNVTEHEGGEQ